MIKGLEGHVLERVERDDRAIGQSYRGGDGVGPEWSGVHRADRRMQRWLLRRRRAGRRAVERLQGLGQRGVVADLVRDLRGGAAQRDRADDGRPEGEPEVAQQAGRPARHAGEVIGDGVHRDSRDSRQHQRKPDTGDEQGSHDRRKGQVRRGHLRQPEVGDGDEREADTQRPPRVVMLEDARGEGHQHQRHHVEQDERDRGLQRGEPLDRRQADARGVGGAEVGEHADDRRDRGDRVRAVGEQLQPQQRRGGAALRQHEQDQEQRSQHESGDHATAVPAARRTLDHGVQQREQRHRYGYLPRPVERATLGGRGVPGKPYRHADADH